MSRKDPKNKSSQEIQKSSSGFMSRFFRGFGLFKTPVLPELTALFLFGGSVKYSNSISDKMLLSLLGFGAAISCAYEFLSPAPQSNITPPNESEDASDQEEGEEEDPSDNKTPQSIASTPSSTPQSTRKSSPEKSEDQSRIQRLRQQSRNQQQPVNSPEKSEDQFRIQRLRQESRKEQSTTSTNSINSHLLMSQSQGRSPIPNSSPTDTTTTTFGSTPSNENG